VSDRLAQERCLFTDVKFGGENQHRKPGVKPSCCDGIACVSP
jgi:hypothetical protein